MAAGLTASLTRRLPGFTLDVALALAPGSVTALVGPSGAGKSTLLRCLAGLERPDAGEVAFDGEPWLSGGRSLPPQDRGVGMVFRPTALFPHLTARQNVAFGAGGPVDDLLARLELQGFADRYPRQLSAGEAQRVALARALASRPRLLLLDEPFTALDPALERRLHEAFRELAAGVPVLLVTHDLTEAAWLGDRLGVLANGKLLQLGDAAEVLRRPASFEAARVLGVANLFEDGRFGGKAWGIRAEHVAITPTGIPARVERVALHRVSLAVEGLGTLEAHAPGLAPGAAVHVALPPEHLLVYPS